MLSKFETKSNRVKGLSFHPKRPWILASLHNGTIQLWDYKMGTLIDKFEEHEGPVRGIAFHQTQPLFVSGGDDYKVKVWNWKQKRCLFTLTGHLDYIRTTYFHHEHPWIISASDDQTIRIWNWQSRNCISILTGHNHYVMCAQFHPKEDLIVSASLDQTVRVWDISGLVKKHAAPGINTFEDNRNNRNQPDLFGTSDAVVKFVLEGHDRGVNWAAFHPTYPLIVSGADDRQVKLWRMNETKAWEVDTCRGHYNNVSSVIFHPRQELIISDSEDKTIRIWDMTKRTCLQTFKREHDRFWVITAHPELNLFAAGHDNGLIVFKLERERIASTTYQNTLFFIKDKNIRMYDFDSKDIPIMPLRTGSGTYTPPRTISYNPIENALLVCYTTDEGMYELYMLPRDQRSEVHNSIEPKHGTGYNAVFVARNRFAVFNKNEQQIYIKDINNETTKQFKTPTTITNIYYAGTRNLLMTTPSSVILFDIESRSVIAELTASNVRYVVWSQNMSMVALLSKHSIIIANKQLEQFCLIHETIKIKSGAWDELGIFIYTTLNHLKYVLPQGDNGIIRTLEQPVYLTKVANQNIHCLDRDGKPRVMTVDPTEYHFKLALVNKKYDEVLRIIQTSNLVGQSIISYLQKKGYADIALHFVKDENTRFDIAIECGNIDVALETAKSLDNEECWKSLGEEALRQGKHQVVESVYQRIKDYDKLSFLYLITGNTEKLKKMLKISELRNDYMSRYHNSLYLGDVEEQIKMFKELGQVQMAYLAAKSHGLEEEAEKILAEAEVTPDKISALPTNGILLKPPTPINRQEQNWPLLEISRNIFSNSMLQESENPTNTIEPTGTGMFDGVGEWANEDSNDMPDLTKLNLSAADAIDVPLEDGGWDIDVEIPLPEEQLPTSNNNEFNSIITQGMSRNEQWARNSNIAVDHIAAGQFESAMKILNTQAGIVNFEVLKPMFMSIYQSAKSYFSGVPVSQPLSFPIERSWDENPHKLLPYVCITYQNVLSKLQEAYSATTSGKFTDALVCFNTILNMIPFVVVNKSSDLDEIKKIITYAREYILGLKMETYRKELPMDNMKNIKRNVELAAYFTHCQMQPAHIQLSLRVAISLSTKVKNFGTTLIFIRRLLELNPSPQVAQWARSMQQRLERNNTDEIQLDYDQYNPFVICGYSYTPIYRGNPVINCPYCNASFKPEYENKLCPICQLALIGSKATGLRNIVEKK